MSRRYHVALDSWRGIAALMVALHHFRANSVIEHAALVRGAWLFVDFFFALSGFVIAATYRDKLVGGFGLARFMLLRLGRLYPLHLFMLALFFAMELALFMLKPGGAMSGRAFFSGHYSLDSLVANLLLVQGVGFYDELTWNGVAWSISTEMWMYALFALAAIVFRKRVEWAMLLLIAAAFVLLLPPDLNPLGTARLTDFARCVYGFSIGVLLNAIYVRLTAGRTAARLPTWLFTLAETAALALALGFVARAYYQGGNHMLTPLALAPAVFVYAFDRGWISRLMQARPLVLLGTLSYSIYMIHPFVQSRLMVPAGIIYEKLTHKGLFGMLYLDGAAERSWGLTQTQGHIAIIAMLTLVVGLAWLSYHFIEKPGRDWMKKAVLAAKRAPAPSAGAPAEPLMAFSRPQR